MVESLFNRGLNEIIQCINEDKRMNVRFNDEVELEALGVGDEHTTHLTDPSITSSYICDTK